MKRILLALAAAVCLAASAAGCKMAEPELVSTGAIALPEEASEEPSAGELPAAVDLEPLYQISEAATEAEAARFAAEFAEENELDGERIRYELAETRRFYLLEESAGQPVRLIDVTGLSLFVAGAEENLGDAAFRFAIAADLGLNEEEAILSVWPGGPEEIPENVLQPYADLSIWEAE